LQRLLEQAHAARTVFVRSIDEAGRLPDPEGQFELAIIEVPACMSPATALAKRLKAGGVGIVATTNEAGFRHGIPGLDGIPVLHKPFTEMDLLTACTIALAGVPEPG
jgi:hypothetical protein